MVDYMIVEKSVLGRLLDVHVARGVGRVSGVVNGHAWEGVALLLSKRVLKGVVVYREVSARLMWVKVKFGGEFWVFVSAYGPGSEEERDVLWSEWMCGRKEEGRLSCSFAGRPEC